jgi:hypothetical protein
VDAFGDESCGDAVITYGLFALPPERVVDVVAAIETIKSSFGAARTARLHCREMFKLDARSKGVWAHLTMNDVFSLYERVASVVAHPWALRIVGLAFKNELPVDLPPAPMKDVHGRVGRVTKHVPLRDKQIAVFCAQAAITQIAHKHGLNGCVFGRTPTVPQSSGSMGGGKPLGPLAPFFR